MWMGPWVACVGLLLFDLRGCFWFGCFLSPSLVCAAFYSLNRGCAGAWPMGIPRGDGGDRWQPVLGSSAGLVAAGHTCPQGGGSGRCAQLQDLGSGRPHLLLESDGSSGLSLPP